MRYAIFGSGKKLVLSKFVLVKLCTVDFRFRHFVDTPF